MSTYLGDYADNETIYHKWDSFSAAGASITRATNGTISVYRDDNLTQTTTGVTDTEDFDTLTGIHHITIVTTDAFYQTGADYSIVLSGATIDGQTVNAVLATFSIENRYNTVVLAAQTHTGAVIPTVTTTTTATTATNLTNLPAMPTDWLTAAGLSAGAVTEITDDIFAELIETTASAGADYNLLQVLRAVFAFAAGRTSGMDTATGTHSTPNNGTTRMSTGMDGNGNRTSQSLTL